MVLYWEYFVLVHNKVQLDHTYIEKKSEGKRKKSVTSATNGLEILVYPSVTNCNKPKVYDECFMISCCQDMESL